MTRIRRSGFTLIELLIVVAIIAILAAIAVPNFLEAQVRSKVSRVKNDLRTQATAIETYVIDNNKLCRDSDSSLDVQGDPLCVDAFRGVCANGAMQLTTPIAYMTATLKDPFAPGATVTVAGGAANGYRIGSGTWSYPVSGRTDDQDSFATFAARGPVLAYVTLSPGPDQKRERMAYKSFPFKPLSPGTESAHYMDYDPTNGTVSAGDIYRFGGQYMSGNWDRNGVNAGPQGPDSL